jgi:hypothetical protein
LVIKSAFEQVEGANKPAKCAQKTTLSQISVEWFMEQLKTSLFKNIFTQFVSFCEYFVRTVTWKLFDTLQIITFDL